MLSLPDADVPPPAQKFGLPVLNLTQEQKRAARQHMSSQGGRNPYADFYQPNPYALRPDGPAIYHPSYYFEGPPAQLPHFRINVFDITIIDILKEGESSSVFKVSINAKLRVLKLFHQGYSDQTKTFERSHCFERECIAYRTLRATGLCAEGLVPSCQGWVELNLPTNKNPPWVLKQFFEEGNFPPAGLLLEYIYDAEPLSLQNITPAIATKAVQGLAKIHSARVLHRDLATNNILVCKGNVVWIGFEFSRTYASETPVEQRLGFRQEMSKLWTDLFTKMLPDQAIGWSHAHED